MNETEQKIAQLEARIEHLVRTQIDFQKEILAIRGALTRLRTEADVESTTKKDVSFYEPRPTRPEAPPEPKAAAPESEETGKPPTLGYRYSADEAEAAAPSGFQKRVADYKENARADFERFIGENLISKIGIIVLIIGVGIGVKYSIDNNLISPLGRVIAGYIFGFGLVGLAIRLKAKYRNFSAALLSGGMAIMYFVTYFGYSAYGLISQPAAFALMAMFTAFTVTAALVYNRQVIAHIGLVGAYAVPFLLSSDSGNYLFLFSYMAVINTGILAISAKRYWTPIFYTASGLSWLIFLAWFVNKYSPAEHLHLAIAVVGIFSTIFYAAKLVHRAHWPDRDAGENMIAALATVIIAYQFTFAIANTGVGQRDFWLLFGFLSVFSAAFILTSFRYFGRAVLYISFLFTWLIYGFWYVDRHAAAEYTMVASIFAGVFFAMFYAAVLGFRFRAEGLTLYENAGLVLTNAFLFYGFGYGVLDAFDETRSFLGAYTVANAAMHFLIASVIGRIRRDSADVVNVLTILFLTFSAIAVPVQFDGNIVTMIWAAEAALLFWFGRTKGIEVFEYFSLPVMALATGSMFFDWAVAYDDRVWAVSELNRQPLANGDLVTALVFVAAFGFIYLTGRTQREESAFPAEIARALNIAVAAIGLFVLYNAFRIEIGNFYHVRAVGSISDNYGVNRTFSDLMMFNTIWQFNYTMGFVSALAFVNLRKISSRSLAVVTVLISAVLLFLFATICLVQMAELRESYMLAAGNQPMNIAIRYISYGFAALLLAVNYLNIRSGLMDGIVAGSHQRLTFEAFLSIFLLAVASGELLNLMAQFGIPDGAKLGLSILWGVYAVVLIAYGIYRSKKHLRIGAIVLLSVTLIKLFFYDVADLDTIPKTILFVTLGITLLIASFLYNKYRSVISGPEQSEEPIEPHGEGAKL